MTPDRHSLQPLPRKSWFEPALISKPDRSSQRLLIDTRLFHSQENQRFDSCRALNADPTHPPSIKRFRDWGSHGGIGATTGGLPLQENETALLIDSALLKDLLINQI